MKKKIIILLMLISIVSIGVYAMFVQYFNINEGISTSKVEIELVALTNDYQFSSISQVKENEVQVNNNSEVMLSYSLVFEVSNSNLINSLILSIDGVELGLLANLLNNNIFEYKMPYLLASNESRNHKIQLEYQIGYPDKIDYESFTISINAFGTSLNVKEYIFVSNFIELKESLSNKKAKHHTIVLLNDIDVIENIYAVRMVNIDLNGYQLNGNGISFNSRESGIFKIYSSREIKDTSNMTSFALNNPNGLILTPFKLLIEQYAPLLLFKEVLTFIDNTLFPYFINNTTLDVNLLNYKNYIYIYTDQKDLEYINETFIKKNNMLTIKTNILINVDEFNETRRITIFNEFDSVVYNLFKDYLIGLEVTQDTQQIEYDLLLPIEFRKHNAVIKWVSSNQSILSHDGSIKTFKLAVQEVKLSAIINIFNEIYIYEFNLEIIPSLEYVKSLFELNTIYFYQVNDYYNLIATFDYVSEINYFGLTAFNDYFEINESNIKFIKLTDNPLIQTYLEYELILIDGRSINGLLKIHAESDLEKIDPFKVAYEIFINDYQSTLENRENELIGFNLLNEFNHEELDKLNIKITYSITNGLHLINEVSFSNPLNVVNMVSIVNNTVYLNPYNFLIDNTIVYIKLTFEIGSIIQEYAIPLELKGILHNSSEDIEDFVLYYELLKIYGQSFNIKLSEEYQKNETFILMDEVKRNLNEELYLLNKHISSIKGIEYFININSISIQSSLISELTPLSKMNWLVSLNLSSNMITDVTPLKDLVLLEVLILNYNPNLIDINSLEHLTNLTYLGLNGTNVIDLKVILNYKKLRTFDLRTNNFISITNFEYVHNQNYFISAYLNATKNYEDVSFYIGSPSISNKYTPTTNQMLGSTILNSIVQVKQFNDVLYLPYEVYFNNTFYLINWSTEAGSINYNNIVTINNEDKQTYITMPVSQVEITLYAKIIINGDSVIRVFNPIALESNEQAIIYINGEFNYAKDIIPDSSLLYALYSIYDPFNTKVLYVNLVDGFYIIKDGNQTQINTNLLELGNYGIKDLTGIEYFNNVTSLTLTENMITSYDSLCNFYKLETLSISGYVDCRSIHEALINITSLKRINAVGCSNATTPEFKELLRRLKLNNPDLLLYTQSLTIANDPIKEVIATHLTTLLAYYVVYKGMNEIYIDLRPYKTLSIPSIMGINENEEYSFILQTIHSGGYYEITSLVNDVIGINYPSSRVNVSNELGILSVGLKINNSSFTKRLVISSITPNILINGVDSLNELIPNESIRQAYLDFCIKNNLLTKTNENTYSIDISSFDLITELKGITTFDGVGLKGLELFRNLITLEIVSYRDIYNSVGLEVLNYLENLKYLRFKGEKFNSNGSIYTTSIIHTEQFNNITITSNIKELTFENCSVVSFNDPTILKKFTNLNVLNIIKSNITNFSFLVNVNSNHEIHTMNLYGNPASIDKTSEHYLSVCYSLLNPIYQGKTNNVYNYQYYMYSSSIIFTLGTRGNISVMVNNEYVLEGNSYLTIIENIDLVSLPSKTDKYYPITWSVSYGNTTKLIEVTGVTANVSIMPPGSYNYAYVILNAYIASLDTTTSYYFIIKGNGSSSSSYLNLSKFIQNNQVIDPLFTNGVLSLIESSRINGLFMSGYSNSFDNITEIDLSEFKAIYSLNGLEVFTSLEKLTAIDVGLSDISGIKNNINLKYINLNHNPINYLHSVDGESYFKNMPSLYSLSLEQTPGILDFRPIAYKNIYSLELRNGLNVLRELYTQFEVWGGYTPVDNYFFDTLYAYFDNLEVNATGLKIQRYYNYYSLAGASRLITTYDSLKKYVAISKSLNELVITINKPSSGSTINLNDSYTYLLDGVTQIVYVQSYTTSSNSGGAFSFSGNVLNIKDESLIAINYLHPIRLSVWDGNLNSWPYVAFTAYLDFRLKTSPLHTSYPGLNDKYIIETSPNNYFDATTILIDPVVCNRMFRIFDSNNDNIISNAERLQTKEVNMSEYSITSIKGLEYFPNITYLSMAYTYIRELTNFSNMNILIRVNVSNSQFISNIEGLRGSVVSEVYINSAFSINSSCFELLASLSNLKTLIMGNNTISNYSGIENIKANIPSFKINVTNDVESYEGGLYSNNVNSENKMKVERNVSYIRQYVFKNTSNRLYKYRVYKDTSDDIILGISPNAINIPVDQFASNYFGSSIIADRLVLLEAYEKGQTTTLPSTVVIDGFTYNLTYLAYNNANAYYLNGNNITILNEFTGNEIQIVCFVMYNNSKTYIELINIIVGTFDSAVSGKTLSTNGYIELTSEEAIKHDLAITQDNLYETKLVIRDEMLRLYLFTIVDSNKDNIISLTERMNLKSLTMNDLGKIITDFSGIELFSELTYLNASYFNTRNIYPISRLTKLTTLIVIPYYSDYDQTTPQTIPIMYYNLDYLKDLVNLKELNIQYLNYYNLDFLSSLKNLTLLTINESSRIHMSMYIRNTIALNVLVNSISVYKNSISDFTETEKLGGYLLKDYKLYQDGILNNKILYNGFIYTVNFIPLSTNIVIDEFNITTTNNQKGYVVASLNINGVIFEKFIEVGDAYG